MYYSLLHCTSSTDSVSLCFSALSPTYTLQTQQILIRTDKLLESGTILETLKHTDHNTIHTLMGKIKQLMTDFDDRLGKRKKKIDESVQLHKLTEMVRSQRIYISLVQDRHQVSQFQKVSVVCSGQPL